MTAYYLALFLPPSPLRLTLRRLWLRCDFMWLWRQTNHCGHDARGDVV